MTVTKPKTLGLIALTTLVASSRKCVEAFVSPDTRSSMSSSWVHQAVSTQLPIHLHSQTTSSTLFMSPNFPSEDGKSNGRERNTQPHASNPTDRVDSSMSKSEAGRYTTDQYDGQDGAFPLPDNMEIPLTRQLRWEREALVQSKYAAGDEVVDLRRRVAELRADLIEAREELEGVTNPDNDRDSLAAKSRVNELEREILDLNSRDAEFVYAVAMERLKDAERIGDSKEIERIQREADEARICIPHLNLHGLWVGKYGTHGYEMINVTYSGDTLVATKVTGDKNVPRGEISFTADLSPKFGTDLEPIELNARAARQWGKKYLPRHTGKGQVATEGYENAQWMEGQLILVGRFFSFAWVPIGHQVFFGRPSPELTIKMLKQQREEEFRRDHVEVMRETVQKCWDETYWEEKETITEVGGRKLVFSNADDDYYNQDGCFE